MKKLYDKKLLKVKLRRGEQWKVKPEAEQLDGKQFFFKFGWIIEDGIYKGESAILPEDDNWPWKNDAPSWLASGDLEDYENL